MTERPQLDAQRLESELGRLGRVAVAFSGGVDSSVVAAATIRAGVDFAIAVTADSPSVPRWQMSQATEIAREIGIEHRILATAETSRSDYRRNDNQRCFFCKQTLYTALLTFLSEHTDVRIVSGTNADDLGDYRPGIEAGRQLSVVTPLADLGLTKSRVRALAAHYGLSNRDLPASPCLASRIAYGTEVTPERLRRVEQAEDWLRQRGLSQLRVRLHADDLARIEVPVEQIPFVLSLDDDGALTDQFRSYGFRFVTIDMEGFRSGSMNRTLVPLAITGSASQRKRDESTASTGAREVSR